MKRWPYALIAGFAALALSGCLRFSADVTLAPDNTVSGTFVVAVKDGSGEGYGMSDREFAEAIWEDYPRATGLGDTTISDYGADGYTGVTVTFNDAPLAAFAPTPDAWGMTRDGDHFVVSGPSDAASGAVPNAGDGEEGAFTGDISQLQDAQFTLAVTFPGKVVAANGNIEGRTVTWDLQHGPAELSARGSATPTTDPAVVVAYIVCGALVIGGAAYALAGRMRSR